MGLKILTTEEYEKLKAAPALAVEACIKKNQGSANVGKILVVGTDGNLTLTDMPEAGVSGDVIGTLDESNNILLTGNLADGTYTLKYENTDGTYSEIGTLEVGAIVTYTITQNLTAVTSDNATASIREGESLTVNLTANDGYNLSAVTVTMGGADVTSTVYSGGVVTIASVTGDVVITAVADEVVAAEPTNFAEPNTTNKTDWSIWCNDARFGSDGLYRQSSGNIVTNYVPIKIGDTLVFEGLSVATTGTAMTNGLAYYTEDKTVISPSYWYWYADDNNSSGDLADTDVTDGVYTITLNDTYGSYKGSSGAKGSDVAYVRISGALTGTVDDVVIRVKRNGEWL